MMKLNITQLGLLEVILDHINQAAGGQANSSRVCDRHMNAIIRAVGIITDSLSVAPLMAADVKGLSCWMLCDETGESSEYLASVLSGKFVRPYAHPHDTDDFGRCLGLFIAVPELKDNLEIISSKSSEWANLVRQWDVAEAAYNSGDFNAVDEIVRKATR